MFGFFNRKKVNLRVIARIENLQEKVNKLKLFKVGSKLDGIIIKLDAKKVKLTKMQEDAINRCLCTMEDNLSKVYEDLLLSKCSHIDKIISNGEQDISESLNLNEDEIYKIMGALTECRNQVDELTARMDSAVGVNKNLWSKLNSDRKIALSRIAVLEKNYNTLLKNQNNVALAEEVRKAREVSENIFQSTGMVDYEEFEANSEFIVDTENEVDANTARMDKVFEQSFSIQSDDYEYEKALEEASLKKAMEEPKKKQTEAK
ncbi:MAG: hypothetical protein E7353_02250 [Clostridiales bacterium]|nr:hypothetical protein [Clostridiales bacterium]